jgi:hypothetical protein
MRRHHTLLVFVAHLVVSATDIIVIESPVEGERVALRGVLFLVRIAPGIAHDFEV